MGSPAKSGGQQGQREDRSEGDYGRDHSEGHVELASVSNLDVDKRGCTGLSDSPQQSEPGIPLHVPEDGG